MGSNWTTGGYGKISKWVLMVLIAKMQGNRGPKASTHPIKSVIVLPAVVAAIFALESERIISYQLPR